MRHASKGMVVVVLFALVLAGAKGFAAETQFSQANRLYEQGNYSEAISIYQSLASAGWNSPAIFFNLGNAAFRNGELGRAIFNYRKAAALAPRDPDIQANLRFARDRVAGTSSVRPGPVEKILGYFRLNELAWTAMILLWGWLGLLSIARYRPSLRPSIRTATIISGGLAIISLIVLLGAWQLSRKQTAIILTSQATVHLGPVEESQAAFSVPTGTELAVHARREEWLQVADRAGRTGWVKGSAVALFP